MSTVEYRGYTITREAVGGEYCATSPDGLVESFHPKQGDAKRWVDAEVRLGYKSLDHRCDVVNERIEVLTGEPGHVSVYGTDKIVGMTLGDLEAILNHAEYIRASRDSWKARLDPTRLQQLRYWVTWQPDSAVPRPVPRAGWRA